MKTTHTVLLAAGLVAGLALASPETFAAGPIIGPGAVATLAGLALASPETFAAGPIIGPGAVATTSVGSADAIVEKTVVVVRRRAVVRRPVGVHRRAVVRRPVGVHRRVVR